MQMRTPIFDQISAQMVVRIDCAHGMRMQKSGCINVAENRTSGTNVRARSATVRILYHTHVGTTTVLVLGITVLVPVRSTCTLLQYSCRRRTGD